MYNNNQQQRDKNNKEKNPEYNINIESVYGVINDENKYIVFVKTAESFAEGMKDKYKNKSSQIRNIYDEILHIKDDEIVKGTMMLKVKLAYASGRDLITRSFFNNMNKLIDEIKGDKVKFDVFKQFMEAFVAYNRKYGGK
jgi:CRISPR type III-A-associated protein Csm2